MEATTEELVWNEISTKDLSVIMSWWEPTDDGSPGNSIAYFHFHYDPEVFPTFDAAYTYFSNHPLVDWARPAIKGEWDLDYFETTTPNDPYWASGLNRYVDILGVASGRFTSIGPPNGQDFSHVDVAVIDDGVWRWHSDFTFTRNGRQWSKVSWIGVECQRSRYKVVRGGALPAIPTNNHGTAVAGLISAVTHNNTGIAALAPRTCIVPIRIKFTGPADDRQYDQETLTKAFRALRFELGHGKWGEQQWEDDVRVVNLSLGGRRFPYWWDPSKDMKENIYRDLSKNDRLYIGSAGNRGNDPVPSRRYPAAFDNVLGVSGLITTRNGSSWHDQVTMANGTVHGSNYCPDGYRTYPVSGIYDFVIYVAGGYYQDQVRLEFVRRFQLHAF